MQNNKNNRTRIQFWLSKAPLINHSWQDKSELSKVSQVLLFIERSNAPSINNSLEEEVIKSERAQIERVI
jgi:hypothetical protein